MIKNYVILLMVFLLGCGLKKKPIVFERQNINSSEMIIDKIKLKTVEANRLLLNAKIKLNDNNTSKINANIRIIKDSLIWISVKAGLGIEIFRTIITPDSIRYINHINKDYFIEYEKYGTDFYGTSKEQLKNEFPITVLDLEVNGATKLLAENNNFIGIFIDIDDDELIRRLKDRGHDNEFITKRMELAAKQRNKIDEFDYVVDNKDINTTISKILNIIYKLEDS